VGAVHRSVTGTAAVRTTGTSVGFRLLSDPGLILETGRRGRRTYLREFTWETCKRPLVEAYERIIAALVEHVEDLLCQRPPGKDAPA
jgi:hypothetical protein